MRQFFPILGGVAATMLLASAAHAGDGKSRASFGYTHYDSTGGELGMITARYGYQPYKYIGIEGELSTGIVDETVTVGTQTADIGVDIAYGLYSTVQVPFDRLGSNVFVRAGYQEIHFDLESGATTAEGELKGLGYGGGLNVMFTVHHGLRREYTRVEGEDDENADTYSLSYVLRF